MFVIGGGIIGFEMVMVYLMFGVEIDVVEMMDGLMMGVDCDFVKVWEKYNVKCFGNVMLKIKMVGVEVKEDGIYVKFEGEKVLVEVQCYDFVFVVVGCSLNGKKIGVDKVGVVVMDCGFIEVDKQMCMNVLYIFVIGDIVGQLMFVYKVVYEGYVVVEVVYGEKVYFDVLQILLVVYIDLEVVWVGKMEDQCKVEGIKYGKVVFLWVVLGCVIVNGCDEGFMKLIFDEEIYCVIGGVIVGLNVGDLISEVCFVVEMGVDVEDIGKMIYLYLMFGEFVGMVVELYEGVCMDLLLQCKK